METLVVSFGVGLWILVWVGGSLWALAGGEDPTEERESAEEAEVAGMKCVCGVDGAPPAESIGEGEVA